MFNFKNNFFFAKFTVLFFILTIFGYWGIDLNSEELYIAFSFFLLVIAGVALSRQAILLIFVQSINTKYFRLLNDLLVAVSALTLASVELRNLAAALASLRGLLSSTSNFFSNFLANDFNLTLKVLSVKSALFSATLPVSAALFFSNLVSIRKFQSFGEVSSKFFFINVK